MNQRGGRPVLIKLSLIQIAFEVYIPESRHSEVFHEAFSRYGDGLYYYLLKLTGDQEKAKDMVQECFLRLWENIAVLDTEADLRPLLVTYIRNLFTDEFRKSQKQKQVLQSLQKNTQNATAPEIENRLDTQDRQRQFSQQLSRFPAKRQTVFRLVNQDGLSYREVAKLLDLSLPDVKKQMRLSIQALKRTLQFFLSLGAILLPVLP